MTAGSEHESRGGTAGRGRLTFSAEDLMRAAKMLQHNLEAFNGPGSPADLQARGQLTPQHLGDWDAGRTLAGTAGEARRQIVQVYQDFLTEYAAVIEALRAAARAYEEGERASRDTMSRIGQQSWNEPEH